jgi:CheY-like chemotaxis protein
MPGIDGFLLSERMRSDSPSTAIILMTGQPLEQPSGGVGDKHLVFKPLIFENLLQKIRDILDQNPSR